MKQILSTAALDRWCHATIACGLVAALLAMVGLVAPVRTVSEVTWSVLAVSGDGDAGSLSGDLGGEGRGKH